MSDTPESAAASQAPQVEPIETFYDDGDAKDAGSCASRLRVCEAAKEVGEQVRDTVLKTVPVQVTEHVVAGTSEFIKAGIALAEAGIRKSGDAVERARELHRKQS